MSVPRKSSHIYAVPVVATRSKVEIAKIVPVGKECHNFNLLLLIFFEVPSNQSPVTTEYNSSYT